MPCRLDSVLAMRGGDARRDLVPNGGLAAAPRASLHYDHHERNPGDQRRDGSMLAKYKPATGR